MAAKKRGKERATASERPKRPPRPKHPVTVPEPSGELSPMPADEEASARGPGRRERPVAGLVASAGGLDAFKKFFAAMPADSGIAFVLIPHLDPTHESLMVELLSRHTSMPVVEAAEGMVVEADRVYIIPPDNNMTISGGVLRLSGPVERGGWQTSIDLFLRSLADDQAGKSDLHHPERDRVARDAGARGGQGRGRHGHGPGPQDGRLPPHARERHRHRPGRLRPARRADAGGARQVRAARLRQGGRGRRRGRRDPGPSERIARSPACPHEVRFSLLSQENARAAAGTAHGTEPLR